MAKDSKFSLNTGVWGRDGVDEISDQQFFAALAGFLVYGLAGTALVAYKVALSGYIPGQGAMIVLGLVIPIIGIVIAVKSDQPMLSFLGYNMVLLPFGIVISPIVHIYAPHVIMNAFTLTCGVAISMGTAGVLFPDIFKSLGGVLFYSLLALILVSFLRMFIPGLVPVGAIDYAGAAIFSLYIGYDMYRATAVPKTLDNAIDIALDLYLDVINLFLFILRILGDD